MKIGLVEFNFDRSIILACALLSGAIFAFDINIPLGFAGGVPYILVAVLSFWTNNRTAHFCFALATTFLTIAGYFFSPMGGESWQVIGNRALVVFAIWSVFILCGQRQKFIDQRDSALKKVKMLSGLLPICSSCKKIRDEQDKWLEVEHYVKVHTEAEFTHCLCQECITKLYPDVDMTEGSNSWSDGDKHTN